MKALTVQGPWAMQICEGSKTIEYRTWKTHYRGDILITSSARNFRDCICGYALCVVELYDITPCYEPDIYTGKMGFTGEYEWHLRNVRPIKPFPIKGKLNLWEADVEERIEFKPDFPEKGSEAESAWVAENIRPLLYTPRRGTAGKTGKETGKGGC